MAGLQSSSSSFTYDVFLSCCGSDTRHGFTGHLLKALRDKGIHTFIEDEGLPRGDEIVPAVFKAIEESRLAIIVFSQNYAASSLRLEELAHILHICQQNRRSIIPVFYEVDPSHVRKQTGSYEKAFARHERHFEGNMDKLQIWRNALHQVASLSGWDFRQGDGYEFQFIERIVEDVSRKLFSASLHVAGHLVGLDSRLEEVFSLLELGSNGVLMVGVHGMAGIGKTTLIREVYNKIVDHFEGSCFLDHVRENSNKHGLVHLQNKLLFEIVGEKNIQLGNVNRGASIIRHRLHQKKVLLILDDVDKLEQLEALAGGLDWFGSGSKIIITTRDKHLLAFHGVERRYEVQELNQRDALELLSHRVFEQGNVDPSYTDILNHAVTYASGLPLALEVIGSILIGRSVDECRNALDRIKRIPNNEIQNILRTSFDTLEEEERSVFLDIACCFNGCELAEVKDILRAHHGYDMKYHIELLIDKSLISISSDGKVTLHPLIEDMGKEIVRQESPKHPGKRSRLWFPKDIAEVLKENTGTSNIEIIHLDSPLSEEEVIEWDGEAFKKMERLRTLIVRKYHFSEAPKHLPYSLRVLEWWRYPSQELPSDFDPERLVIRKLPDMGFMSPRPTEILQTSENVPEVPQIISSRVAPEVLQIPNKVFQDEPGWRLVGLVSSVVGLLFYALSPSFNSLIGGWSFFKFLLYVVFSLIILTIISFAKQSSLSTLHVLIRSCICFAVLIIISVYSYFYDRAVNGKPEIRSLVSNAAFALISLSLSKLMKFGFEMGAFAYFLGCLTIQLWTINWKLIFVAILFGYPLFVMHFPSDSGLKVTSRGQVIHSRSNSRPEVGSGGQHVIDIHT